MKGTLVRCYDECYEQIGTISWRSCWDFTQALGLGFKEFRRPTLGALPGQVRIDRILEAFKDEPEVDFVIYADVDILFNPNITRDYRLPSALFKKPFTVSSDTFGICDGFMVIQRDPIALKILELWLALGYPKEEKVREKCILDISPSDLVDCDDELWAPFNRQYERQNEQSTLKLLGDHFYWIHEAIHPISPTIVSNPHNFKRRGYGQLAHHFWANGGESYWGLMKAGVPGWPELPSTA